MSFCLLPNQVNKIKEAVLNGSLTYEKLNSMSSQESRDFFSSIVGEENVKELNLLLEKKMLLKNQEKAMYDFIRDITGLSAKQKADQAEKIKLAYKKRQERILKLKNKKKEVFEVLHPGEDERILNELASDIYSKRYKTELTLEETQRITELSQDIKEAADKIESKGYKMDENFKWRSEVDKNTLGIEFGSKKVALDNYISDIKINNNKRHWMNKMSMEAVGNNIALVSKFVAENARAMVAGFFDNSFFGRQGRMAMTRLATSKAWMNNFVKSFKDGAKTLLGSKNAREEILDACKAEIYSRENFINGRYERGYKIDVGTGEEQYPTSSPSKIPVLGRLFSSAEVMYEGGAMRMRADIADAYYKIAEKTGVDLTDKSEIGEINKIVNVMTGRGRLGRFEQAGKNINLFFFSAKFAISKIQAVTDMFTLKSKFAREQAAKNLFGMISSSAIVLGMAEAMGWTDIDPRSSNFGKIKIGNSTIDVTGGMGSYATLLAKIIKQSSKNTETGIITKLGQGYGSQNGMDVFWQFTENKFSPIMGLVRDVIRQETFSGKKPTIGTELAALGTPILISTGINAKQKDENNLVTTAILLADWLGFSANTSSGGTDWSQKDSMEMAQFKEKVGEKRFKEANDLYNARWKVALKTIQSDPKYKNLSEDEKQTVLTNTSTDIKKKVFQQYNFKAKPAKKAKPVKIKYE